MVAIIARRFSLVGKGACGGHQTFVGPVEAAAVLGENDARHRQVSVPVFVIVPCIWLG